MIFKKICLEVSEHDAFLSGLQFEIATSRCEGVRLLRVDITGDLKDKELSKFNSSLIKALKKLKQKGIIQLFAFPESFERHTTEAVFLLNKYSESIDLSECGDEENFLYILI